MFKHIVFRKIGYYLKHPKFIRSRCEIFLVQMKWYRGMICRAHGYRRLKRFGDKQIGIGILCTGGLGDYIVESRVIDEIREQCNCVMDVYCTNVKYGQAIFSGRSNVRIRGYDELRVIARNYDLFICLDHWIYVWYFDDLCLRKKNVALLEQMSRVIQYTGNIRPKIKLQCYREALHFMRCEKLGIDRWTEQRCGDVFSISDHKTYIPLYEEYHARVDELGLGKTRYITVNRGADSMGRSGTQTKVWAKDHYDRFVLLFKERFPDIKVVQLGVSSNDRIEGVDSYAFDESIEAVKWLLRDSLLHVDCEGGLVHLATQMETKCIVLFGPTPLHMYGYEQNINLQAGGCHNCMGLHENWAFECFRGMEQPECMYSITPEQVLTAAADYLGGIEAYEKNIG